MPCIVEVRVVKGELELENDDRTSFSVHISNAGLDCELRAETTSVKVGVTKIVGQVTKNGRTREIINSGTVEEVTEEPGAVLGIFGSKKKRVIREADPSFTMNLSFVPEADEYTRGNAMNLTGTLASVRFGYSYSIFQSLIGLYQSFKIDSLKRSNRHEAIVAIIEDRKLLGSNQAPAKKGKRGMSLQEFLVALQKQVNRFTKRSDERLKPLDYHLQFAYDIIKISMLDDDTHQTVFDIAFPKGNVESGKIGSEW
jgi:hypothetical protein